MTVMAAGHRRKRTLCLLGKRRLGSWGPPHALPQPIPAPGRPEHSPSPLSPSPFSKGPFFSSRLCRRRRNETRKNLESRQDLTAHKHLEGPPGSALPPREWGRHGRRDLPRTLKGLGVGQTCLTPSQNSMERLTISSRSELPSPAPEPHHGPRWSRWGLQKERAEKAQLRSRDRNPSINPGISELSAVSPALPQPRAGRQHSGAHWPPRPALVPGGGPRVHTCEHTFCQGVGCIEIPPLLHLIWKRGSRLREATGWAVRAGGRGTKGAGTFKKPRKSICRQCLEGFCQI